MLQVLLSKRHGLGAACQESWWRRVTAGWTCGFGFLGLFFCNLRGSDRSINAAPGTAEGNPHPAAGLFAQQLHLLRNSKKHLAHSDLSLAFLSLTIAWILVFCDWWTSPNAVFSEWTQPAVGAAGAAVVEWGWRSSMCSCTVHDQDAGPAVFCISRAEKSWDWTGCSHSTLLSPWEQGKSSLFPLFRSVYLGRWPWGARSLLSSKLPVPVLQKEFLMAPYQREQQCKEAKKSILHPLCIGWA